MAKVGTQRAAELTGRSKSTIQRAMKSGKISSDKDANGRAIIDVSELERVFGLKPQQEKSEVSTNVEAELKRASEMIEFERQKMRIKMLEDKVQDLETQLDDLKSQRDLWQKQAHQVLLTTEYTQKQADEYKEKLVERERREELRRKQMLEAKMQRLKGQNENQKVPSGAVDSAKNAGLNLFKKLKKA